MSADGEIRKRQVKSRVCRCQQENKYTPRVGDVGQTQRERKLDRAAERDCPPRIAYLESARRRGSKRELRCRWLARRCRERPVTGRPVQLRACHVGDMR
jgi:hypothetical protein